MRVLMFTFTTLWYTLHLSLLLIERFVMATSVRIKDDVYSLLESNAIPVQLEGAGSSN